MIAILLDHNGFEQDIRELLMAFYPAETYCHEDNDQALLTVTGRETEGSYEFVIQDGGGAEAIESRGKIMLEAEDRYTRKSQIKKLLYEMLCHRLSRTLPWGTLTGIRPTKIALARMEQGCDEEEIQQYMKTAYLAGADKIRLCTETASKERSLLSQWDYRKGYSLYLGIPFCPTTCLYCSFPSYPIGQWKGRMQQYLDAIIQEMRYCASRVSGRGPDTIYIGGGTPTSLEAEDLNQLLNAVEEIFDLSHLREITVEAGRPDSITEAKLAVLRAHSVGRISINPQTMKQKTLDLIGRHHTVDMVKDRFHMAREMGFHNINMDFIVGLPGETLLDVQNTMEEMKKLNPDGITVHSLAIKRTSRLNLEKEKYSDLSILGTAEMIDLTAHYARECGMEPYYLYRQKNMAGNFENVGYARPGSECLYNILIMEEKQTILACGAGTTTKVVYPEENRLERAENVKNVEEYVARVDEMMARKEKLLAKSGLSDTIDLSKSLEGAES